MLKTYWILYNMIELSSNYSEARGGFSYKDETTSSEADISNNNKLKSFEYETKTWNSCCTIKISE